MISESQSLTCFPGTKLFDSPLFPNGFLSGGKCKKGKGSSNVEWGKTKKRKEVDKKGDQTQNLTWLCLGPLLWVQTLVGLLVNPF